MTTEIFGVVLKPDDEMTNELVDYSLQLDTASPSDIVLSPTTPFPHLTIAHFSCNEETAVEIWEQLEDFHREMVIEPHVFYLRHHADHIGAGLMVFQTTKLRAFHEAAVAICESRSLRVNNARDHYWPHFTLARWNEAPPAPIPLRPTKQVAARPVLTRLGQHGTATAMIRDCK